MTPSALRRPVLVIGGQGMVGRPVVRRLIQEGFLVRLLARDPGKAAKWFAPGMDIVPGNLTSISSLDAALSGCRAVYVSVDTPPGPSSFRPETQGLENVIAAAANHPNLRLLLLSALGISEMVLAKDAWWHLREKQEAQRLAQSSGLPWTIFEPTWFMESLPLFVRKKVFSLMTGARIDAYWVAGDDYGRMISAALSKDAGKEEIIRIQGADKFSLEEAGRLFCSAYDPAIRIRKVPLWMIAAAGWFSPKAKEFSRFLKINSKFNEPPPNSETWSRIARPEMSLIDYAAYVKRVGDFPQK